MTGVLVGQLALPADCEPSAAEFTAWMAGEQKRVFLLCCRMLGDRDEADSATQDTFLKAHRALRRDSGLRLQDPSKWLVRIAVNTCLDRLRSRSWRFWRRRAAGGDEPAGLTTVEAAGPSQEDHVFARQIERRLAEALGRLTARQRAVFALRHYEDRPLEQIAEILEIDPGTVKAHLARALAKLRVELRDLYAGVGV
jgi:RNA polymerase sigma-70 factor (ECF subfamily)